MGSEEVFDFSSGQMTQTKAKHLKDSMCSQFSEVFTLCQFVMDNSNNAALVGATLDTLLKFLNWIPLGYIFETKLIQTLILKFLTVPMFRNVSMKCLTEIAGVTVPHYDEKFIALFTETMTQLEGMLPVETNIKDAFKQGSDQEQMFIQNLAMFFCSFLKEHGALLEKQPSQEPLLKSLHYLLLISEVDDVEISKICLEYWNALAADLYRESPFSSTASPLFMSRPANATTPARRGFYQPVLSKVRYIMICKMAKPEEVLVVENDQGEVVREFMKDTDSINMYKNMRETLVYLTHLDYQDTEKIMTEKLANQVNGNEWSWKNLNTLCWAIGSISGSMHEEDEKRFLVTVIKDLLGLCEQKKGKDNKAIIASNIMYIVGQYPRFLRAHWRFLKTVVNKLFEFIHELLGGINSIICDLQPQQVQTFYEAVGHMISASTDQQQQEALIEKYMQLPNAVWDDIINQASRNVDVLKDHEAVKQLGSILKTNVRACKALGHPYVLQLGRIYLDMLNVYKVMSENITIAIWAFKHTMRNVADTGLNILYQLLQNVSNHPEAAQSFYQTYYTDILQHMFSVVTDTSHTAGLNMHATILAYMFTLVETNKVTVPLSPSSPNAGPANNVTYVQEFVANLLRTAFPHLSDNQIKITVTG